MKKLSLFSVGLFCTILSYAQGAHAELGLKGGVNIANYNDEVNTKGSRTGYFIGGLAHIHLTPTMAVQPEVVYSAQGAEYSTGTDKLDYINIPVLFQYMFNGGFRLETGPQLGLLTSAKFENNNGVETSIKSNVKSNDVSWAFGAGYLTPSGLGIDARYNLGISNIRKPNDHEIQNRVWQLGVFYQFRHY